nr:hypothetical protein [uncultured Carboxylicivirga sp.]
MSKLSPILDIKEEINADSRSEYVIPSHKGLFLIIIYAAILVIIISQIGEDYTLTFKNYLIFGIIGIFMIIGLIVGIMTIFYPTVSLAFDLDGIFYDKKMIKWIDVKNLYYYSHYDGDNHNIYIKVLISGNKEIEINIDTLNHSPEIILKEVGKYYWNWKKKVKDKNYNNSIIN